jgi:TetR/AcrR family transcriptional regulator
MSKPAKKALSARKKPVKSGPVTRDPARTRARILASATELFAISGYDGTSLDAIVAASGFNKRMIYHYFGDKEGLYRAIFKQQWGDLREWFEREFKRREESGTPVSLDAGELLIEVLGATSDFMAVNRRFVRLVMWEGLEGGAVSRSIWTDVRGPMYAQIEFLIRSAQERGKLNPRLDPAHLVISFLGAVGFYFAYAPTLGDILHQDPFGKPALAQRKNELKLLLKALGA